MRPQVERLRCHRGFDFPPPYQSVEKLTYHCLVLEVQHCLEVADLVSSEFAGGRLLSRGTAGDLALLVTKPQTAFGFLP